MSNNDSKPYLSCPICGSPIKAWADLDATVTFDILSSGKLSNQTIINNLQSDSRCGVECSDCDWSLHLEDMDTANPLRKFAVKALSKQENIETLTETV